MTSFRGLLKSIVVSVGLPVILVAQSPAVGPALSATERSAVVSRAADTLTEGYVFEDVGAVMARVIRERLAAGAYDALTDAAMFAAALTSDLQAVNGDRHLRVTVRSASPAAGTNGASTGGVPPRSPLASVERLAGNVGYVKIDGFPSARVLAPLLDTAMSSLRDTDALLIDLRDNRGGAPDGAMYLAGFFFERPTLVARVFSRQDGSTTEMRTETVSGPRYLNKPLLILTSQRTFSAGEAAAYHLKHVARAITVGEPTGGGAHRIRSVELHDRFTLALPFTRPINVVTNGDWEGSGVTPDVPSSAEGALTAAHLAALRRLPRSPERDAAIARLERAKT